MSEVLVSILDKLPTDISSVPLQLSGNKVQSKFQELKAKQLNLSLDQVKGLAILLQNIPLSIFTNSDFDFLSTLPLHYLETLNIPHAKIKFCFSPDSPIYDTGTNRIYSLIDSEDIANTSLQLGFATYGQYEYFSFKELVTALYKRGY